MGGIRAWGWMPVVPSLEKRRQENQEFKGSLSYVVSLGYRKRPCEGETQEKQTHRDRDRRVDKDGRWVSSALGTQVSQMMVVRWACL